MDKAKTRDKNNMDKITVKKDYNNSMELSCYETRASLIVS
jgi:hypothetical protein